MANTGTQGLTNSYVRGRQYPINEYETPSTRIDEYVYEKIPFSFFAPSPAVEDTNYLIYQNYGPSPSAKKNYEKYFTDTELLKYQPIDPNPQVDTYIKRAKFLW